MDFIIIAVVLVVVALAAGYVIKAKKSGKKCIGCSGGCCSTKNGKSSACRGNCSGCSGCHGNE